MKKVIILIALMSLLPHTSFAQNMDEQMFQSICLNLLQQDSFNTIAQKLKNKVVLVADPVSGYQWIKYIDTSDSKTIAAFKRYTTDDQIKILTGCSFPYLPLADTLYIIDTNGFFNLELSFEKSGHEFKIDLDEYSYRHFQNLRKYKKTGELFTDKANTKYMFLHQIRLYQNQLTLSFVFNNNEKGSYTFSFNLNKENMTPGRSGYDYDRFNLRDY